MNKKFPNLAQNKKTSPNVLGEEEKAKLKRDIQQQRLVLQSLEKRNQSYKQHIDRMQNELKEYLLIIDDLSHKNTELQAHLHALYSSTSWRVLAPVRISLRQINRIKNALNLIPSALQQGGGIINTSKKAVQLYQKFGFSGIKSGFRNIAMNKSATAPSPIPSSVFGIAEDEAQEIFYRQQAEIPQYLQKELAEEFLYKPLISIIMPVYNTPVQWLERAIQSLQEQTYTNWELCAVDDCSPETEQRKLLKKLAQDDSRIRYHFADKNGGISKASNLALEMTQGEFIALVDHDDELTADAFFWVVKKLNENSEIDFLYSDECKIDDTPARKLFHFIFKPDWSPEILFNGMLTGHLTVYRTALVKKLGGFRSEFDFSQDYDLALRVTSQAKNIVHIERILYLWRAIPGSAAVEGGKDFARISNIAALNDYLEQHNIDAEAIPLPHANYVRLNIPKGIKASIIIPSDDYNNLKLAIVSILEKTDFDNYEIVCVCNSKLAQKLSDEFKDNKKVVFSPYDKPYNFSDKCNQGAHDATGDIVIFYNDDVFPVESNWLQKLIEYLFIPGVEGVSPKLIREDNTIQYAGMISGTPGLCGTAYNNCHKDANDFFLSMHKYVRNVSVLSGACCALRKNIFLKVGGFDAINTPDGHSDLDLTYKLIDAGYRCVYTPHSLLYHIGNHSWGSKKNKYKADIFCLKKWGKYLSHDPHFTDTMKEALYLDFRFKYKIYASHLDPHKTYSGPDVLFVSHELSETGAPLMLYYAALAVLNNGGFPVVISRQDGPLRTKLEEAGIAVIIDASITDNHFLFNGFAKNFDTVIINTVALHQTVQQLTKLDDLHIIWWLHEARALEKDLSVFDGIEASRIEIVCVSEYAKSFIPKEHKSQVLANGIPDLKPQKNTQNKEFTFSLIGTIEKRKAQDTFVDAILMLPEHIRKSCKFKIAGKLWNMNLKFWEEIETKISRYPEIEYLGSLSHEQTIDLISHSDVLVCCSRDEAFSLTTVEAAALAKPAIVNKNVGVSAVFTDKKSCLFFEADNVASLAETMITAFQNKEATIQIGKEARKVYSEKLSIAKFQENFLKKLSA
ncbi:glycosyltransferase [Microvirga sp. W0021]|uniref:Glycosyltransferase n=1 Tax=Hohaiivirga grylli TaxID=3133970 RepID=A0ABV0BMJ8_9HYPH